MLTGWKEIEQHVGLTQKVLRPLIESAGLPVRYIKKTPITTPQLLDDWAVEYIRGEKGRVSQ